MPQPNYPRTPGYRFKDGRLMIFDEHGVMLIRGWNEPLAVQKSDDCPWEPFIPEFRLVAPYRKKTENKPKTKIPSPNLTENSQLEFGLFGDKTPKSVSSTKPEATRQPISLAEQHRKAFDSFRFSLPKEVAKVIEPFRSHQWPLLVLLANDKRVLDLATANPVLAYAVADWYTDYPRSKLDFGRMPQRALLKLLKMPDSASLVKIFRKIPPSSIDRDLWPNVLTGLRRADEEISKWLSHVPTVNQGVMELIFTPRFRPAVTPSLLAEVAADPREKYRGRAAGMISDVIAMRGELADDRPVARLTSLDRVESLHANEGEAYQKLIKIRRDQNAFPPPPIPGVTGHIEPIKTQADLVTEGRNQKHCCASYASSVVAKACYFYKVMQPTRATLCINRQPDGNWGVQEIKASCNGAVDAMTLEAVNEWLAPYRFGI